MFTMFTFFLLCALAGGAVLIVQALGSILGLGGDDLDMDGGDIDVEHGDGLLAILSFRTLTAALTFFGLFGLLANSLHLLPMVQILAGSAGGVVALLTVWYAFRTLKSLGHDATMKVQDAVGSFGKVNVSVPSSGGGAGKIMLELHGRLEEFAATTSFPEKILTGARVRVVAVHPGSVMEVEPAGAYVPPKPAPLSA